VTERPQFVRTGTSGGGAPLVQMLDFLFGRKDFVVSEISHQSLELLKEACPPHWQAFFEGLQGVSLQEYVLASEDQELRGIFSQVITLSYWSEFCCMDKMKMTSRNFINIKKLCQLKISWLFSGNQSFRANF
jgi:hypothetical protein